MKNKKCISPGVPAHDVQYGLDAIIPIKTQVAARLQVVANETAVSQGLDLQVQFTLTNPSHAQKINVFAIVEGEPVEAQFNDQGFFRTDIGIVRANETIPTLVTVSEEANIGVTVELIEAGPGTVLSSEFLAVAAVDLS
ncbi:MULTISPECIES: hypothetical protein [Bacillaceae]|uniref:hypothetical protein n=1 Tax=Bacillaceae TaxID=186817 RepID=UPI001C55E768|nr:hypothetical protein [Rossellomorea sp. YZS02]MBW3114517.1 hypothetical protein [Bacillus sp. MCCB 382]MDX8344364.1 hypothetical protein [Rossellomorea sp. YZS02]